MNETPRVDQHLCYVPERFQAIPEFQGLIKLARELERDLVQQHQEYMRERDDSNRLKEDLSAARQSLYEVAAQRNELLAAVEKYSVNAEPQ